MSSTSLCRRLRYARTNAAMSMQELADALSVSKGLISHWESGYRTPSTMRLRTIAWVCRVDVMWLMFGESAKSARKSPTKERPHA